MVTVAKTIQPVRMPRFGHRVDKTDPILRGCVGWWPLNDGAGSKAKDISGYGNDGTQSGGVSWTADDKGVSASFDGVDDRVDATVSISDYPVSLTGWFRTPSSAAANEVFISVADSSVGDNQLRMYTKTTGVLEANVFSGTTGTVTGTTTVDDDAWHFGAVVFESSTSRKLFVDGYLEATDTTSVTISACDRATIGVTADSTPAAYFDGNIQNVRVYNRTLSATEVSRLYNEPWAGLEPLSPFSFFSVPTAGAPLAVFYNHYKNQGII